MALIPRLLFGLIIIIIGFLMVWKTMSFQEWTGRIDFAEDKFGPGGTNTFLKLAGALVCFVGVAMATNLVADIVGFFMSFLIGG